ncbi:MAG TPA: hypothetical protein VFR24_05430 [Candidatus Angelobacter sp.]|nr:hypothetical protein [Candidatus Angelobacter sp.]
MKSILNSHLPISPVRLIAEAVCPQCGPLTTAPMEGIISILLAQKHTAETAHVVVLNGTIDVPQTAEECCVDCLLVPVQWGEA